MRSRVLSIWDFSLTLFLTCPHVQSKRCHSSFFSYILFFFSSPSLSFSITFHPKRIARMQFTFFLSPRIYKWKVHFSLRKSIFTLKLKNGKLAIMYLANSVVRGARAVHICFDPILISKTWKRKSKKKKKENRKSISFQSLQRREWMIDGRV